MTDDIWQTKSKIRELMQWVHTALVCAWYLVGIIASACLWFFQIPESRMQSFFFMGWFVLYSALAAGMSKVKEIAASLEEPRPGPVK